MTAATAPRAGASAPDLTLAGADGAPIRLSDLWTAAPTALALVLVRHFG
jgi:peroxiredoxin